jgi:hypothetical protein
MTQSKRLGLDELMIVNPDHHDGTAYVLGADNKLRRVRRSAGPAATVHQGVASNRFYLADDGTLYEVLGPRRASGLHRRRR